MHDGNRDGDTERCRQRDERQPPRRQAQPAPPLRLEREHALAQATPVRAVRARAAGLRLSSHSPTSFILSSSLRNARLSRVEHAVWLIPSTRAALGPSSSSRTRNATTSRSAGDSSCSAASSGAGSPSPNSSMSGTSRAYVSSRRFRRASRRGTSRRRRCARSGTARCAASRGAGRSAARSETPSRTSRRSDPRPPTAIAGQIDEVAVHGVELLGSDVGKASGGRSSSRGTSSEDVAAFTPFDTAPGPSIVTAAA